MEGHSLLESFRLYSYLNNSEAIQHSAFTHGCTPEDENQASYHTDLLTNDQLHVDVGFCYCCVKLCNVNAVWVRAGCLGRRATHTHAHTLHTHSTNITHTHTHAHTHTHTHRRLPLETDMIRTCLPSFYQRRGLHTAQAI